MFAFTTTNTLGIDKSLTMKHKRPISRELGSLWKSGAHFPESDALARFLKSIFLKSGRFQSHKIVFFQEIRNRPDFRFPESWILVPVEELASGMQMCVCVCVFFPFILDINGCTSRGHTGGRSHRIFHPPSFCGACLYFSREKDSAIPFPRRP